MPHSQSAAKFYDLINARATGQMEGFLKDNARFLFPKTQPLIGKERIMRFFQVLFRQYPELVFTVQGTIAEGDRVAVHWKNRGINRKNEPYENEGVTIFEFEDGKIVFMNDFFKDTERF